MEVQSYEASNHAQPGMFEWPLAMLYAGCVEEMHVFMIMHLY